MVTELLSKRILWSKRPSLWGACVLTIEKRLSSFLDAEAVTVTKCTPNRVFLVFKRTVDLTLALFLLPGLLLCMVILFVLNRFYNPGSMIYTQERVGLNGTTFRIYKFRTMFCEDEGGKPRFATDEKERISRLGAFMRRTRIDEVPQILNVLKGEMSVVGPRPEQVYFYDAFSNSIPGYDRRQTVRPGITGLAQLKYGYTNDRIGTAHKLRWDLEYIQRQGLRIELYVMWHTFLFVMGRLLNIEMKSKL